VCVLNWAGCAFEREGYIEEAQKMFIKGIELLKSKGLVVQGEEEDNNGDEIAYSIHREKIGTILHKNYMRVAFQCNTGSLDHQMVDPTKSHVNALHQSKIFFDKGEWESALKSLEVISPQNYSDVSFIEVVRVGMLRCLVLSNLNQDNEQERIYSCLNALCHLLQMIDQYSSTNDFSTHHLVYIPLQYGLNLLTEFSHSLEDKDKVKEEPFIIWWDTIFQYIIFHHQKLVGNTIHSPSTNLIVPSSYRMIVDMYRLVDNERQAMSWVSKALNLFPHMSSIWSLASSSSRSSMHEDDLVDFRFSSSVIAFKQLKSYSLLSLINAVLILLILFVSHVFRSVIGLWV